jgi:hypothetical protein
MNSTSEISALSVNCGNTKGREIAHIRGKRLSQACQHLPVGWPKTRRLGAIQAARLMVSSEVCALVTGDVR